RCLPTVRCAMVTPPDGTTLPSGFPLHIRPASPVRDRQRTRATAPRRPECRAGGEVIARASRAPPEGRLMGIAPQSTGARSTPGLTRPDRARSLAVRRARAALRGLPYGVSSTDPVTFGAVVAILGGVALLASARRPGAPGASIRWMRCGWSRERVRTADARPLRARSRWR